MFYSAHYHLMPAAHGVLVKTESIKIRAIKKGGV